MQQSACAVNIRLCGGNTKRLPIAKFKGKWISAEEIAGIENPPEMAIIIDHTTVDDLKILSSYVLDDNVFITEASGLPSLLQSRDYDLEWPSSWHKAFYFNTLTGAVVEALSIAWKVSLKDVLSANDLKRETKISIGKEGERDIQVRAIKVVKPSPTTPISI
jgi:hypothetical protein